ncbi:hypothetical protein [Methylorubrum populi]
MRVFDCFLFFNELDLLEIRLHELDESVDVFVIVEATVTFKGNHKPLYFSENRERFAPWLKKIRHLIVDDTPDTDDPWVRQYYQRECLRKGFEDASPEDLIIISDVDEILSRDGVNRLKGETRNCYIETLLFYQSLNLMTATARTWSQTFGGPKSQIDSIPNFSEARAIKNMDFGFVDAAGWHFSSVGNVSAIMTKLSSISENSPQVLKMNNHGYLEKHKSNRTLFFTGEKLINIHPGKGFPGKISNNIDMYCKLGLITEDYEAGDKLVDALEKASKARVDNAVFIPEILDPTDL